jgi:hypothetical protein
VDHRRHLISVHDQSVAAISKDYRHSDHTPIIICARTGMAAGQCWPGNRNDVVGARHTMGRLLDGHVVLGDSGYRGITSITAPRRGPRRPDHLRRSRPDAPPR